MKTELAERVRGTKQSRNKRKTPKRSRFHGLPPCLSLISGRAVDSGQIRLPYGVVVAVVVSGLATRRRPRFLLDDVLRSPLRRPALYRVGVVPGSAHVLPRDRTARRRPASALPGHRTHRQVSGVVADYVQLNFTK